MALNSSTHRQPGEDYKGKNGFRDSVKLQMKNQLADPVVSSSDTLVLDPILVKQRALHESVEKYHMAEEVLEFRGSYCPGLDAMQEFVDKNESSSDVRDRLTLFQRGHREGNHALIERLAQDYQDEAHLEYFAKDDAVEDELVDNLFTSLHHYSPQVYAALSTLGNYQYADMSTFVPMVSQCTRLKTEEDAARRKRDAQFPMTASEFRVIRSKDMQVRIARFLLADKMTQERMMTEFGWVYRQINPLLNEYRADPAFKDEVRDLLGEFGSLDPRRKPSNSSLF